MARLDAFLSEPLRRSSPSDLIRYRVLVGSTLVCLLFSVLNLFEGLLAPSTEVTRAPFFLTSSTVVGTLFLLRRTASLLAGRRGAPARGQSRHEAGSRPVLR